MSGEQENEAGTAEAMVRLKCPVCKKTSAEAYRPFCSKRCADVDLHRWLQGGYVIAAADTDEEDSVPEGEYSE